MRALPYLMATLVAGSVLLSLSLLSSSPDKRPNDPETQTFVGTVAREGEDYVLRDEQKETTYRLDDLQKAPGREGQVVEVSGTLDVDTNTIRVTDLSGKNDEAEEHASGDP